MKTTPAKKKQRETRWTFAGNDAEGILRLITVQSISAGSAEAMARVAIPNARLISFAS